MSSKPGPPPPPSLASDEDAVGTPLAAAAPPQLGPTPWISFSGAPNEPGAPFVQSVQRIAFMQNRIKDDEWMAEYASTCFTESAMEWYLGLDKDTRSSWEKLRLALVQRYPVSPPKPSTPAQPKATSPAIVGVGRIEVLRPEFGESLGYLSQDWDSGETVIDANPQNALKLKMVLHNDFKHQQQRIYSLRVSVGSDTEFPFLGLQLLKLADENRNTVPPTSVSSVSWSNVLDIPPCCKSTKRLRDEVANNIRAGRKQSGTPYAMWEFTPTKESKPGPYHIRKAEGPDQEARVVSAVWTVISATDDTMELGLTWPEGNQRQGNEILEMKIEAVVHEGKATGLHAHPHDFARRARPFLDENHVVRKCITVWIQSVQADFS